MRIVLFIAFLTTIFCGIAQQKIEGVLKKELTDKCNLLLEQTAHIEYNVVYNIDTLKSITSPNLFQYFQLLQHTNHYIIPDFNLVFDTIVDVIKYNHRLICRVKSDKADCNIYFTELNNELVIDSYANRPITEEKLKTLEENIAVLKEKEISGDLKKVESLAINYTEAYLKLISTGKESNLKDITTPLFFEYLVLNNKMKELDHGYMDTLEVGKISYLKFYSDTLAIATVEYGKKKESDFFVHKINGKWFVYEISDEICAKEIIEIKSEIRQMEKKLVIVNLAKKFEVSAIDYIKTGNERQLRTVLTDSAFTFIELFKNKIVDFDTNLLAINGFILPKYKYLYQVLFSIEEDSAIFIANQIHFIFVRENGNWMLSNFIKFPPDVIINPHIEESFEQIKELFNFYYSREELQRYQANQQNSTNITKKTEALPNCINYYSYFPPEFNGGVEFELAYLTKNLKYPTQALEKKEEAIIFVQFIVEIDGSLSNISIVHSDASNDLKDEALRLVKNMPNWKPARYQFETYRGWYILPIFFKLKID